MGRRDPAVTAQRLYERFVAPLVLGGTLAPGPAIGARMSLGLDGARVAIDLDLRSRVDVARVRVARRLVPLDVVDGPDANEWSLAAALHDLVHALHPAFSGVLRHDVPDRLFDHAGHVLERVPPPSTLSETVSRHTLFARALEIERTDTLVAWWSGSRRFLGESPPARLLTWPGLRRVRSEVERLTLDAVASALDRGRYERFRDGLSRVLRLTPLTDLATAGRSFPRFEWTSATLSMFAAPNGRCLGLRALDLGPADAVDLALGRSLVSFEKAKAWDAVALVADVLGERCLASATGDGAIREVAPSDPDVRRARALGSQVALERLDYLALRPQDVRNAKERLVPLARMADRAVLEALRAQASPRLHFFANAAGSVGGSRTSSDE